MYFSIQEINSNLYNEAKEFFIKNWRSDLLYKKQDSLIWAYLITQYMLNNWKIWFSFQDLIFNYENLYFSTSHSWNLIALAINDKKIAIDLEIIKPRNDTLLKNIPTLNKKLWTRENFCIQRCAKECLIKYLWLNAEHAHDIKINNISFQQNLKIQNHIFNIKTEISYQNHTFYTYELINNNYIIATLS